MNVYVPALLYIRNNTFQPVHIHNTPYGFQRLRIYCLDSDFQLCQSGAKGIQQLYLVLSKNIRRNFKMKICDTIVVILDILPDGHSMLVITVKSPVDKLDLFHPIIQEKLQFLFYDTNVTQTHCLIDRRKAITAPVWASPAGLIINNFILKRC